MSESLNERHHGEKGPDRLGDEAELARMGYKQELKYAV